MLYLAPATVMVNERDEDHFTDRVNSLIDDGYVISSSNVGFVQSESYDFCGAYYALMVCPSVTVQGMKNGS